MSKFDGLKVFPAVPEEKSSASPWGSTLSIDQQRDKGADPSDGERRTDWRSIYLCTLICFFCQVQFSLFLNSQFAFMKTLDPSISEGFFGIIVGLYSLIQIVTSPFLGFWSNKIKQVRLPLYTCNAFMLFGNVVYFFIALFPLSVMKYAMLISRLGGGLGAAQNSLLISYGISASTEKDRTKANAWITGGIALGITIGPTFQWMFTYIGYPGLPFGPSGLSIDMFTAPALFAVLMNVLIHILLQLYFRESYVGVLDGSDQKEKDVVEFDSIKLPPYDKWALAVCGVMRFTQYLIFTNLETIGTSFAMMMFSMSTVDVVTYESFAHTARGALTLVVYAVYIVFNLGHRVNERLTCLLSLVGLLLFHLITFSWPFLPQHVAVYDSTNATMPQLGCEINRLDWCRGLRQVDIWLYYLAIVFFIGIGFPNINATMMPLVSRIIGPRLQTREQGILEMCGGMGRMIGPSVIGQLYHSFGPRPIWILESAEIAVMIVLWLAFYRRLVPLKIPEQMLSPKAMKRIKRISHSKRASLANSLTA